MDLVIGVFWTRIIAMPMGIHKPKAGAQARFNRDYWHSLHGGSPTSREIRSRII